MPHDTATQRHHEYDVYCEHSIYSEQCLMTQLHKDTMNMMCIVNIVSIVNNAS